MSNVNALSGGGSGGVGGQLDVQWIVEQIIYAKQQPIRDLETYEIFYEAKKEAFQELNTRVSAVESALYTLNSSAFENNTATLSTEDYLSATASTTASTGAYSIVVKQLAQAESWTSGTGVADPDSNTVFSAPDTEFTITPRDGSTAKTINAEGKSLNQVKEEINLLGLDLTASVIQYDTNDYRLVVTAGETGEDNGFVISGNAAVNTLSMAQKIANQDAQISVNNPGSYISRSSNTISDVISGVTLNLNKGDVGETTTLTVESDSSTLKENIQSFVESYNEAIDYLNAQFTFNEQSERSGVLSGEASAVKIKNDLLSLASGRVGGIQEDDDFKTMAIIGIELDRTGHLEIDEETLDDAIENNFDSVERIFKDVGSSNNSEVSFIGTADETQGGTYAVNITQAATQMYVQGTQDVAANLAGPETLTITYGGTDHTVELSAGLDPTQVVNAINTALDNKGIPAFAQLSGNRLQIITDDYGSSPTISVSSDVIDTGSGTGIGFSPTSVAGQDVEGTIGGNAATGNGRRLTGTAGDSEGMMLYISSTTTGDKGEIYFTRGAGEALRERMFEHSFPYTGLIAKNIDSLDNQLDNISDKISAINRNLETEAAMLIAQFSKANEAMAEMSYLQSQLGSNFG